MFSIIELQTKKGKTAHLYSTAKTYEEAMSKYHTVLAAAAISEVDIHACLVVNEQGGTIAREDYTHIEETPEDEMGA